MLDTKSLPQSQRYDEMDEDEQSQVSGALVGHSVDDFQAGESVVLTLADQSVLEGDSLNQSNEMLENVNMVRSCEGLWLLRTHA